MQKPDPEKIMQELEMFQGGVVDTSTLIYMERISILQTANSCFKLLVPSEVVQEFGRPLPDFIIYEAGGTGIADQAVVELAAERYLPVLSEDRKLLMASSAQGLSYYNTLMILMALLIQQRMSLDEYHNAYSSLREIARYSPAVWSVGQQVFSLCSLKLDN